MRARAPGDMPIEPHHGFVEEREALHGVQRVRGSGHVREHDPRLTT